MVFCCRWLRLPSLFLSTFLAQLKADLLPYPIYHETPGGHTDASLVGRLLPVWVQSQVEGNVDAHCFSSLLTVETVKQGVFILSPLVQKMVEFQVQSPYEV